MGAPAPDSNRWAPRAVDIVENAVQSPVEAAGNRAQHRDAIEAWTGQPPCRHPSENTVRMRNLLLKPRQAIVRAVELAAFPVFASRVSFGAAGAMIAAIGGATSYILLRSQRDVYDNDFHEPQLTISEGRQKNA